MKEHTGIRLPGHLWMLPIIMVVVQLAIMAFFITCFEEKLTGGSAGIMIYSLFLMYCVGAFLPGIMFNFAYLYTARTNIAGIKPLRRWLLGLAFAGYAFILAYNGIKHGFGQITLRIGIGLAAAYLFNLLIPFGVISWYVRRQIKARE